MVQFLTMKNHEMLAIGGSGSELRVSIFWVNFITTRTLFDRTLESWLDCGKSSPAMAQEFRLVNYCNLPRIFHVDLIAKGYHDFPSRVSKPYNQHLLGLNR